MRRLLRELDEQRLRRLQVGRLEPLGEPVVDRSEDRARVDALAARARQTREAHRGSQLECSRALCTGYFQSSPETGFGGLPALRPHQQVALDAMQLGFAETFVRAVDGLARLLERAQYFVDPAR